MSDPVTTASDQCQQPDSKRTLISFRPRPLVVIKSAEIQLTITNSLDQMSVVLQVCVCVRKRRMKPEKGIRRKQ